MATRKTPNDRSLDTAIKKTIKAISVANVTIDELMQVDDDDDDIDWDYDRDDSYLFLQDKEEEEEGEEEIDQLGLESLRFDEMTPEEIRERIRCRCKEKKKSVEAEKEELGSSIDEEKEKRSSISISESGEIGEIGEIANIPIPIGGKIGDISRSMHSGRSVGSSKSARSKRSAYYKSSGSPISSDSGSGGSSGSSDGDEVIDGTMKRRGIKPCMEFLNVKDFATLFIDELLDEAESKAETHLPDISQTQTEDTDMDFEQSEFKSGAESSSSVMEISTIISIIQNKHFTPARGRDLILDSIDTWQLKQDWSYCINLIGEDSDSCADFYKYQVIWSLPTAEYPIPQTTASVFYTIEVSRVTGADCPVTVSYNFETERYTFKLSDDINHEHFLDNILRTKKNFFKALRI